MPRAGPRPFNCIRRAWHRDRHKPMRGLLIQEIFKSPSSSSLSLTLFISPYMYMCVCMCPFSVFLSSRLFFFCKIVCEIHSQSTKKNTEWQEKLPVVVLRAEEILYSKANSEVEYMDMETLLDRTNDAINTIIRLDETTETGEFLQPCIEAALHLGCTPRKASRSQRNINPRCYLSQEPTKLDNILSQPQCQVFMKPTNNFAPKNLPVMSFHRDVLISPQEKRMEKGPVSRYSSYPLCYPFRARSLPISNNVTDSCKSKSRPVSLIDATNGIAFGGCDLSLRLGPLNQKRSKISNNNDNC